MAHDTNFPDLFLMMNVGEVFDDRLRVLLVHVKQNVA